MKNGWRRSLFFFQGWGCDIGGAKELGVIYFPTNVGAKEPQNLRNHRVDNQQFKWTMISIPPRKLTWLAGKSTSWVDVFPIEHGDFPASHVSELRGVMVFDLQGICIWITYLNPPLIWTLCPSTNTDLADLKIDTFQGSSYIYVLYTYRNIYIYVHISIIFVWSFPLKDATGKWPNILHRVSPAWKTQVASKTDHGSSTRTPQRVQPMDFSSGEPLDSLSLGSEKFVEGSSHLVSPRNRGVSVPNGLSMAYKWGGGLLIGMIVQVPPKINPGWLPEATSTYPRRYEANLFLTRFIHEFTLHLFILLPCLVI